MMEFSPIKETELGEELSCCFCLELFSDPVVLDCSHNLCRSHVSDLAKTVTDDDGTTFSVCCPICREMSERKELAAFKTNLALANVINIMKKITVEPLPNFPNKPERSRRLSFPEKVVGDTMVRIIKVTDLVFVGGNGAVQAIDCSEDTPIPFWRTRLHGTTGIVSLSCELDKVYAACNQLIFCIEASTGLTNWSRKLSKSTFNTSPSIITVGNYLILGVSGYVIAIAKDTGDEVWTTNLKGYRVVTLQFHNGDLYAGTGGCVFSIDAGSGTILWKNKLSGFGIMGLSILSFDNHLLIGLRGYLLDLDKQGVLLSQTNVASTGYNPISLLFLSSGNLIASSKYDQSTKKEIWRNSLTGCGYPLGSSIVYYSNRLWVGLNGKFLGLNVNTGEEIIRFDLSNCSGFVSLMPFKDQIFVGGEGFFGAYNLDTGFLAPVNVEVKGSLVLSTSKKAQDFNSSNLLVMQETFNERLNSRGLGFVYS